ncbi:MAG: endonuclease/exonuclease/phosphatase family protein [Mycoplasmataceae bacterium]|nr:endonuclease/exonuclease/phosphatase family protein [Mycoplasmataceae bacterium]
MNIRKKFISLGSIGALMTPFIFAASCSTNNAKGEEKVKFATFNLSFATDNDATETYQRWVEYMSIKPEEQTILVNRIKNGDIITPAEKVLSERVVSTRNIAAIIQKTRPDVLLVNEFNNNGDGNNKEILKLFQNNYLSIGQSLNSMDGGLMMEPITYPFYETYATNTGLESGMDLNNDGLTDNNPQDAFGFGYYHGHYAMGIFSKYEIDVTNTRTFQEFKWKDLPNSKIPTIETDNGKLPVGMNVGDNWFTDEEWSKIRLSSKNHVDIPIKIKVNNKTETIHLLASHPTPPAFEIGGTKTNLLRNMAEVKFWQEYIENKEFIYDDKGVTGGIDGSKEKFIILGDLNADNLSGDSAKEEGILGLIKSNLVNGNIADGNLIPISKGAELEPNSKKHPKPETRTSTFGLRVDWVLPSKNMESIDTGVFWQADGEEGRLLFDDKRLGKWGNGKEVSSDHRLVWLTIKLK